MLVINDGFYTKITKMHNRLRLNNYLTLFILPINIFSSAPLTQVKLPVPGVWSWFTGVLQLLVPSQQHT